MTVITENLPVRERQNLKPGEPLVPIFSQLLEMTPRPTSGCMEFKDESFTKKREVNSAKGCWEVEENKGQNNSDLATWRRIGGGKGQPAEEP